MQCGNNTPDRIIEQDRTYPYFLSEPELMGIIKERLILSDRLALVIEDRPAGSNPAWICVYTFHITRLGLYFLLYFTAKAVRVGETVLDIGQLGCGNVCIMRLTA